MAVPFRDIALRLVQTQRLAFLISFQIFEIKKLVIVKKRGKLFLRFKNAYHIFPKKVLYTD